MNNWLLLIISLIVGTFIASYVIITYNFNHFESIVIGMITMLFSYIMLRMDRIDKNLFALQKDSEVTK